MDAAAELCDAPIIADPPSFADVRARLAALRDRPGAAGELGPGGAPTPDQADAMRESIEILSDPEMVRRVRAGRAAVASGDVIPLAEPSGSSPATPGGRWRVVLTGPAAKELEQCGEPSAGAVRELLRALAASPAERGRALGMGLVGLWSAREGSRRALYGMQEEERRVTVLTVEDR
ncbi:MAG: type II toxin-antitoxin system RelE family toxin [Thermoleophilaceae bacterium]